MINNVTYVKIMTIHKNVNNMSREISKTQSTKYNNNQTKLQQIILSPKGIFGT